MPQRLQILFVDDEPLVLEGLRRQLHPLRGLWELSTANSGEEALLQLSGRTFDVVVSDMRMPGMDGAALLTAVAGTQPQAVRFILSGFSEREEQMRTLGPAQRWLSKPCDAGQLRLAVERSLRLHAELAQPAVLAVLAAVDDLLLLPAVLREMLAELATAEPSAERTVGILAGDPQLGIATAMLAEAIGLIPRAATLPEARPLERLKPGLLRGLALAAHLQACCGIDRSGVWKHGLIVSRIARAIAAGLPASVQEQATTAGLLHDSGRLIFASLGADRLAALAAARARGLLLEDAEREVHGCGHGLLGAALLARWGLPDQMVEAVAWHHRPMRGGIDGALAVHLADALSGSGEAAVLDMELVVEAGVAGRLEEWRSLLTACTPGGDPCAG